MAIAIGPCPPPQAQIAKRGRFVDQRGNVVRRDGNAIKIPLAEIATMSRHELGLGDGLHPFRDGFDAQAFPEANESAYDVGIVRIVSDPAYK